LQARPHDPPSHVKWPSHGRSQPWLAQSDGTTHSGPQSGTQAPPWQANAVHPPGSGPWHCAPSVQVKLQSAKQVSFGAQSQPPTQSAGQV
jgi:hypothetical protein